MVASIARFFGLVFVWHAVRQFNSYPLLGSQSYFDNPWPEWLVFGLLQLIVGALLLWKPKPWNLIAGAVVLILWCIAYPISCHLGDSTMIVLLLGLALVHMGGDGWIPLATAPAVIGLTMAALWKLHNGHFSVRDITNLVFLRFPWMDGLETMFKEHPDFAAFMSNMTVGIELAAPFIWILLFFPKLWLVRSILALLPISLLFGIGITGNLDEFPAVILAACLLVLGPRQLRIKTPINATCYVLAAIICIVAALNLETNLRRIYFSKAESIFDTPVDLIPKYRAQKIALLTVAPYWNMYSIPDIYDQMFGGETDRIKKLEARVKANEGCGLELDRWERIYWDNIRQSLKVPEQQDMAIKVRDKYKALEGRPCSAIVLPPPT